MSKAGTELRYRSRPQPADVPALRRLVASTGVFHPEERAIALELLEERLARGARSGYEFFFAERAGRLVGYAAWGNVPLTRRSYDLYWIAVAPATQGQGVGQALIRLTERAVAGRGGGGLYIETSSRAVYARTRRFYRDAGYREVARLRNFYAPGDHKVVFCKTIRPLRPPSRAAARQA
ncbi:MAG TPA: GNAT family N-acetyltransferase [Gammaproteobacteria bacterium]|nr:GNAT family N-acetyltransferase [Gammaproteobacteria bacterium]